MENLEMTKETIYEIYDKIIVEVITAGGWNIPKIPFQRFM